MGVILLEVQRESHNQEKSHLISNKILSHWILITSWSVGNMEPQEFNEGAPHILKRQERDLVSYKKIITIIIIIINKKNLYSQK